MKKSVFDELLSSIEEAGTIIKGKKDACRTFRILDPNVPEIRQQLGLTQERFASLLGISTATLKNWEQGRRKPDGPARVLLCVAAKYPRELLDTVQAGKSSQ